MVDMLFLTLFVWNHRITLDILPDIVGNGVSMSGGMSSHLLFVRVAAITDREDIVETFKLQELVHLEPIEGIKLGIIYTNCT